VASLKVDLTPKQFIEDIADGRFKEYALLRQKKPGMQGINSCNMAWLLQDSAHVFAQPSTMRVPYGELSITLNRSRACIRHTLYTFSPDCLWQKAQYKGSKAHQ
jgi:hypothetical protein